jgi:hypothetical protein
VSTLTVRPVRTLALATWLCLVGWDLWLSQFVIDDASHHLWGNVVVDVAVLGWFSFNLRRARPW